ncbi:MAG: hypothetical protein LC121_20080 [Anaerolineae bacterium]|nr:hypothetical protein [Anaerolineae bacterium]
MSDEMSGVQRFFTRILPKRWAEDMEAHSRLWMLQCPNCGFERSVWDMGGIRWRATGNSRNLMPCPNCGQRGWHRMYKKEEI